MNTPMSSNPPKTQPPAKKAQIVSNSELPPIGDVLKSMKDVLREDGLLPNANWHCRLRPIPIDRTAAVARPFFVSAGLVRAV